MTPPQDPEVVAADRGVPEGGGDLVVIVVAYEAASTIREVLDRVPAVVGGVKPVVLVLDDAGSDSTADLARDWAGGPHGLRTVVVRHRVNLGYGANQRFGYLWAADHGFRVAALVHGDGQYPPERLDDLVAPVLSGEADAVFGSRMIEAGGARLGGMPWVRRVGNRALSAIQNRLVGAHLSEWHSGFRAYDVATLGRVGLESLPDRFDFDTAIIPRLLDIGARIREVSIPTHYGDEVSRVQPFRTGIMILIGAIRHRLGRDPRWPERKPVPRD